ncbi:DEKNAAC104259 [Brettanomyces naardenensis]|uniref:Protein arginine methyltransferase NDUFAF7 n=1 Tax=Brettanomyces naardenensis TaxID=13370 RepID=A0A448YQ16_BRENA|nr:DEKNAAC104259 [Brettanomyces naardenensis]
MLLMNRSTSRLVRPLFVFGARSFRSVSVRWQEKAIPTSRAPAPSVNNLSSIIKSLIDATGPIPISSYMKECLINPKYGYYTTRDPLDVKSGDFITSPEISSTFGEMCGMWFFSSFIAQLKQQATFNRDKFKIDDKTFRIVEYGPGRGTLMYDILRVFNRFVAGNNPIEVVLIEKSDVLIKEQYKTICDEAKSKLVKIDDLTYRSETRWGNRILWLKDDKPDFGADPDYMNFVIAHEFFDALPINRFVKTSNGWREFLVDLKKRYSKDIELPNVSHATTSSLELKDKPEFTIVESPRATLSSSIPKADPRYDSLIIGSKVEICPESHTYLYEMADLVKQGDIGAGLIIDYGKDTIPIETLRGIKNHKFVDPMTQPGEVDLSADVDFGKLAQLLKEQKGLKPLLADQGDWLNSMGLGYRIDQLISMHKGDEKLKKNIVDSYKRLTGKDERDMGKTYKVLGFFDDQYEGGVGFEKPKPSEGGKGQGATK